MKKFIGAIILAVMSILTLAPAANAQTTQEPIIWFNVEKTTFICGQNDSYYLMYYVQVVNVPEGSKATVTVTNTPDNLVFETAPPTTFTGNGEFYFSQIASGQTTLAGATVRLDWGEGVFSENSYSTLLPGNCVSPPNQPPFSSTITSTVRFDRCGVAKSGYVLINPAQPVDTYLSVDQNNGVKGGMILENILIPAGTRRYRFSGDQLTAITLSMQANPGLPNMTAWLTTAKGGIGSYFDIIEVRPASACRQSTIR